MSETTKALTPAEKALAEAEKHKHAAADAWVALCAAKATGDSDKIAAASAAHAAAVKAHADSGVTDRDIANLAQAVLDERGEAHTEIGVLPSDFGDAVMQARKVQAEALQGGNKKKVEAATADLAAAEQAHHDASQKLAIENHAKASAQKEADFAAMKAGA